jgi:hypothetical protein
MPTDTCTTEKDKQRQTDKQRQRQTDKLRQTYIQRSQRQADEHWRIKQADRQRQSERERKTDPHSGREKERQGDVQWQRLVFHRHQLEHHSNDIYVQH